MITTPIDPIIELPTITVNSVSALVPVKQRRFYLLTMDDFPVLEWDGGLAYDNTNASFIIDDPIEGGFTSHDKVRSPMSCTIFATVTDPQRRRLFLEEAEAAVDSVTLYKLVTPDITHTNLSIIGVNGYRNPDNFYSSVGASFKLREVRLNGNTRIDKTAEPTAASQVHGGQVTPTIMPPVTIFQAVTI